MLLRPKKLRKYQEMELTLQGQDVGGGGGVQIPLCAVHPAKWLPTYQDAPRLVSSMPLCNIGLNFRVRGNGTLAERERKTTLMRYVKGEHVCGGGGACLHQFFHFFLQKYQCDS